jgi:transposase
MRQAGMSSRAIASGLGVSKNTVTEDVSQIGTPSQPTIGTDGKAYQPPAPRPQPSPAAAPDLPAGAPTPQADPGRRR